MTVKLAVRAYGLLGRRDHRIGSGGLQQQIGMLLEPGLNVVYRVAGTGDVVAGGIHVHHETCRGNANQDQHNQTNAFLTVVRAVREGHADSREDQGDTRPERRLFLAILLFTLGWGEVNTGAFLGVAPVATEDKHQAACKDQADNRREDQRSEDIQDFRDVQRIHQRGAGHQRVG